MKKRKMNMDEMFHCVITLNSGLHQTLRVALHVVAHIVTEFKKYKNDIFKRVAILVVNGQAIVLNNVKEMKFVHENGGAEFLSLT